ncbi:MAG TPA: Fic family protein [Candidatus Sulfopaludibacter sp.]|jgi:fido (protein-threonine AMPylation protein)|nr:Fic family protein [Candidatus Sulfopaludibacter sp.]
MDRKAGLAHEASLAEFHQRFRREWAIETGMIEGVYTFDRGITQTLIEHGINSSVIPHGSGKLTPEHVASIIEDHAEVLDWLFDFVKGGRELTTGYIKELHAALLRHQDTTEAMTPAGERIEVPLERGIYKTLPNTPTMRDGSVHEYCPPEHVASEMDRLIRWHGEHAKREIPPEVEAAWLHHRFTQIHPFQDGNGRVARAIASLVLIKADWFPLVVRSDEKIQYLEALERADFGDLGPLVSRFSNVQKTLFLMALDSSQLAKPPANIDAAVDSARDLLVGMGTIVPKEWTKAFEIAQGLRARAQARLEYACGKLLAEISISRPDFQFSVNGAARDNEVHQIAEELHYSANLRQHSAINSLRMQTTQPAVISVSFHGVGNQFRGLLAASAFFVKDGGKPVPVCPEFFLITYDEDPKDVQARFDKWLEDSIVRGLDTWQRSLI